MKRNDTDKHHLSGTRATRPARVFYRTMFAPDIFQS